MAKITVKLTFEQLLEVARSLADADRLKLVETLITEQSEEPIGAEGYDVDLVRQRTSKEWVGILQEIIELRHDDPTVWFLFAEVISDIGQHRKAFGTLEKVIRETEIHPEILDALMTFFAERGSFRETEKMYERKQDRLRMAAESLLQDYT